MSGVWKVGIVGLAVAAIAVGAVVKLTEPESRGARRRATRSRHASGVREDAGPNRVTVPLLGAQFLDDSGFQQAVTFTPEIADRSSLPAIRDAVRVRAERGRALLQGELESIDASRPGGELQRATAQVKIALMFMYEGKFSEAMPWIEAAAVENPSLPDDLKANLVALRGVASLRRGELDNCVACVGPSSCIFPIAPEARHVQPSGSREAVKCFGEYLAKRPEDLGVRWLLEVASMTLGTFPDALPTADRLPSSLFGSTVDVGRFRNVAAEVGLGSRGANMFGGSIFDDFDGDGRPDIFVCSADCDLDATLFLNRDGKGFEESGASAGLSGQTLAANASHADFDNDGRLDVLLLRGGWDSPFPLSLLHNEGGGMFEDVTGSAGLGTPIACQSGAWGDFDNDGFVDLYSVGEMTSADTTAANHGRLYRNNGDGTFTDVAERAGVQNDRFAKGAAWGDYDGDDRPDLYVSNAFAPNRLYHNNGDGTFTDVAPVLDVAGPIESFSCGFWDYDNDGRLDIFVAGYHGFVLDVITSATGDPVDRGRCALYKNIGEKGFRDVSAEVGLNRVYLAMGSNVGDIDNDGFLDLYLGTGRPNYSCLIPNVLLKNDRGEAFRDVSASSGTAHLQKGHGVSFADWDGDGNLDLFVEMGGATPGDRSHNVLFQNPGHGGHWLSLKLVGKTTNHAAIGAKVRVDVVGKDGGRRSVYREIGAGSSFGGNSLVQHIGLGDADSAETVEITWPTSHSSQVFRDVFADRAIVITEGAASLPPPQ